MAKFSDPGPSAPASENVPPLKGLGSCSPLTSPEDLSALDLSWYYNWRPFSKLEDVPGVEFVPMFWSASDVTPEILAAVNGSSATHVLGFNEPDGCGQANMTPLQCVEHWPKLMTLKQRLGSPGPASAEWLDDFMPMAAKHGLRVDFVCLQRYPDISKPKAVNEVETMLTHAYRKFGLPIWLTECGAADVAAWHQPRMERPTAEMARKFLRDLLAMLKDLPFVERYAWFADRVGKEYYRGSIYQPNGPRLTPIGKIYRDEA